MKAAIRVGFVSFCLALVAAVAYGQARTPYTRPSSITTPGSIQTSASGDQFVCTSTTATCEVESAASATTMTSTVPAFDIGPTATPGANDRLACFSYGPSGSKTRVACVDKEGDFSASGNVSVPDTYNICFDGPSCTTTMKSVGSAFEWRKGNTLIMDINSLNVNFWYRQNVFAGNIQSNIASGGNAYTCGTVGCRLSLGSTGRYLVDDGTNLEFVAPLQATTFEATTASGSSLTGGGASGALEITSNTPDSFTSGTVPAIRLKASQNITDADLLLSVEDSAGNRRLAITEAGNVAVAQGIQAVGGSLIASAGFINNLYLERSPNSITIADNGAGTAAAYTWQPGSDRNITHFTCNDANGCDITMSETGAGNGFQNRAINLSANTINFTDTAGVIELAGNFAMGQYDVLDLHYAVNTYVEVSRSNN